MQRSKKNYRRYLLVLSLLVSLIAGICTSAFADSYTYDIRGNQIPAPDAYELERTVYASELGLESMSTVSGVFYRDGKVYVTLKGTIVITDENFENATYITEYTREDNTKSSIKAPTGIWVTGMLPVKRTIKNNKFLYRQPCYGWRYFMLLLYIAHDISSVSLHAVSFEVVGCCSNLCN